MNPRANCTERGSNGVHGLDHLGSWNALTRTGVGGRQEVGGTCMAWRSTKLPGGGQDGFTSRLTDKRKGTQQMT